MRLEFELEKDKISENGIEYIVKRKGLYVGFLYLEGEYKEAKKNVLILE